MWRRIVISTRVDHPVERVFGYLADPLLWHQFAPAVVFRRQIGDRPPDVGTRWMATDQVGPFRFHFVDELAELEPDRRVVWISSAPWNARVEYRCTPEMDGTWIQATYEGDVVGLLRILVGWLPTGVFGWILARDFRRLNHILTKEAKATRRWRNHHPDGLRESVPTERIAGVEARRPAPAE